MNGLNLLIFPRHSHPQLYDATLGALNQAGAKVNVSHKAYSQNTLISMVAANLGVCFTPVTATRHPREDVVDIDIVDHLPTTEIHAIWRRKYTSRLTKSFIDFLMSLDET
jgi:DNA-binding transcriptional LysR family regulator